MFKKIIATAVLAASVALPVFAGGNADVVVKYSGPSGMGDMTYWNPTNHSTNIVFTTIGNVEIPGTLTVGSVVSNGTAVLENLTVKTNLQVGGTVQATGAATFGTTLTTTGIVAGVINVTSYGYPLGLTGTSGDGNAYLTQFATNDMRGTTQTNTFPVSFIATPVVVYQANNGVMTNVLAISSNLFTSAGTANAGGYIAVGRIK